MSERVSEAATLCDPLQKKARISAAFRVKRELVADGE